MPLPPCPKCGKNGVYRNLRCFGWVQEIFTNEGKSDYIGNEGLQYSDTQRLYCWYCSAVRRDLRVCGSMVITIAEANNSGSGQAGEG